MSSLDLKNTVESLIITFLNAGKIAKEISQRGVKITIKNDKTPVTDGDLAVDKLLKAKIKNLTPDIHIISEETTDINIKNKKTTFWLIDPIDGTRDYIEKRSEYTINASLIVEKVPVIGIINAPKKNRIFFSYGKNNAFEISGGKKIILNCKKKTEKGKVFAVHSSDGLTEDIIEIHNKYNVFSCTKMSSSLKFCVIAAGEADIYAARARAYEWDIAAGHAILEHAGGHITTIDGKKILYGKKNYKNPAILLKRSNKLDI